MKKIILIFITCMFFVAGSFAQVSQADSDKAFKILKDSDDALFDHGEYSATVTLLIERPNEAMKTEQYKAFLRVEKELFTLVTIFPEADKGMGYISDKNNIWYYDPIGRKFTHCTLRDNIGDSDVTVDDVKKEENRWRKDFKIIGLEEGKLGKYPVNIVSVEAITNEPAYKYMKLFIRKDIPLTLKVEDYSGSKRLMRTVLMPKYGKVPTGYVPVQTIYRDELNPGEKTQEIYSDITYDKLPDKVFTKAYLESLN